MAQRDPPSPKQQRYLRTLAEQTGTSFTPPQTRGEASREIDRLKNLTSSPRHEKREDRKAVDDGLERRGGGGDGKARRSGRLRLLSPVEVSTMAHRTDTASLQKLTIARARRIGPFPLR